MKFPKNIRKSTNIILLLLVVVIRLELSQCSLTGRCATINDKSLTRVCAAEYPTHIKFRYLDEFVNVGLKYAVFSVDDTPNHYFITHGFSRLHNCTKLKVSEATDMTCDQEQIKLKSALMVCLDHRTSVAEELVDHCDHKFDTLANYVVMHYNDPIKLLPSSANVVRQFYLLLSVLLVLTYCI